MRYSRNRQGLENMWLVMEGDYGGQTYLTCPVNLIKCDQNELEKLHVWLDKRHWDDFDGISQYFISGKIGESGGGGMGGYILKEGIWFHEDLTRGEGTMSSAEIRVICEKVIL